MNNSFLKNGNFTGISQAIFIIAGMILMAVIVSININPNWLSIFLFMFGLFLAFFGGFSARAQLSDLRVFGEPDWKRAKRTYTENESNPEK
ncbi:hypothetical protein [Cupriavidus sp. UYPR2.512]|uniref:hypothetical protein n=1 Tax=Cupriavidus sp. UYPR2.512 TaxID=1080187 RepID=UPI0012FA68D1|nr:hypothetical protein [Cupriavidus sp. UYPR2.512]UIF87506.1 hypothetical protein KAF44_08435 [Cupriavidus necator]